MKKTLKTWVVISIVISAIVVGAIIENVTNFVGLIRSKLGV